MRVLVVTPYPVLPPTHGGRVRTYALAAALAAEAEVDVLCPWGPGEPFRRFHRDGVTFQPHFFAANVLPLLFRDRLVPSPVALSLQPFAIGPRRRLHGVGTYDVVQFEFCAHAGWMERVAAHTRVIYSAHNVEYDFWRGRDPGTVIRPALRRLASLERRAVGASDLVVAATEGDADRLRELYGGGAGYAVIANGFDQSLLGLDRDELRRGARAQLGLAPAETALLFVGGPAAHNRAAASFLERELMPQLGGTAKLLLVGEVGEPAGSGHEDGAVLRLGYVEDLASLLAAADVALNPVTSGSGSNLKLAEYLAAGLPVVTTLFGMRGFEQLADRLTITDLSGFAAAVRAPKRPSSLPGSELGAWTWQSLGRRLYLVYEELLRSAPRGPRR